VKARCSFAAKCYFGPVNAVNPRIPARRAVAANDRVPGQKAEFHQPSGDVLREVEAIQHALFTRPEIGQRKDAAIRPSAAVVETHLQHKSSMGLVPGTVNNN
jgi:hypothetical protein